MRAPAFPLYADDFFAGSMEMSQAEVGAYIRLLCHQWNRGSIPVEPEKQQRLAGGPVSVDVLSKFPAGPDGLLRNERLERERVNKQEYHEHQRLKGIASGEARRREALNREGTTVEPRLNHGSSSVGIRLQPEGNLPSPSPIPFPVPLSKREGNARAPEPPKQATPPPDGMPVEFPPGFPKTEEAAKLAAASAGCSEEFAAAEWNLAAGRGGRDAKEAAIRSWPHHLKTRHNWAENRRKEQGNRAGTASIPGSGAKANGEVSASVQAIQDNAELGRIEARIKAINESVDSHAEISDEDRVERKRLKERREILKRKLGVTI